MEILGTILVALIKAIFGFALDSKKDSDASKAAALEKELDAALKLRESERELEESMRNAGNLEVTPEDLYSVPPGLFADIV